MILDPNLLARTRATQGAKHPAAPSVSDALSESVTELACLCTEAHVRGSHTIGLELTEAEILVARAREASRQLDRLTGRVAA